MQVGYYRIGGRLVSVESDEGKEYAKWEKPYKFEPFPRMLYMARRRPDGVPSVTEGDDSIFGGRPGAAEAWNTANQLIVKDETAHAKALEAGWRPSPQDALNRFEEKERAIADAAAHRNYVDRNMSDNAKAEAEKVEAESFEHVPEIPEKKRGPGRPRKQPAA